MVSAIFGVLLLSLGAFMVLWLPLLCLLFFSLSPRPFRGNRERRKETNRGTNIGAPFPSLRPQYEYTLIYMSYLDICLSRTYNDVNTSSANYEFPLYLLSIGFHCIGTTLLCPLPPLLSVLSHTYILYYNPHLCD